MDQDNPALVCIECGSKFHRTGKTGPPSTRCKPCRGEYRRAHMRAYAAARSGGYKRGPHGVRVDVDGHRECKVCKQVKPLREFYLRDAVRGTRRRECIACRKISSDARYHADRAKHRDVMRRGKYGLLPGEYDEMALRQQGLCAVCGEPETSRDRRTGNVRGLFVDHNHQTGRVRELLCTRCNFGIGHFRDDPELLGKAITYLLKHPSNRIELNTGGDCGSRWKNRNRRNSKPR